MVGCSGFQPECHFQRFVGRNPGRDLGWGGLLHELPKVGVRPIKVFIAIVGLESGYTISDILVVNYKLGGRVASVCPYRRA